MMRRARVLSVVVILAAGALGTISSTQSWLTVVLADGVHHTLDVPGAAAIPVLAPLSLAVLALGGALSIVGLVLRYVFGALTLGIGGILGLLTAQVVLGAQTSHLASTVTTATGITGTSAIADIVAGVSASAWPAVTLGAWIVLLIVGVFTVATARTWKGAGRRYATAETAAGSPSAASGSRPHDAIDDWDDLSRGEDPTASPLD